MEKTSQILGRIVALCVFGFVLFANFSISLTQLFGYLGAGLWGDSNLLQPVLAKGRVPSSLAISVVYCGMPDFSGHGSGSLV